MARRRSSTVAALGAAQTLAWASSYYLPAVLAAPIAHDLGVGVPTVFAAFSASLVIAALLGPLAGRAIDRWGGRPVLASTNLAFIAGLGLLALAEGPFGLFAAWAVLGVAMGGGLYEAAFAALVGMFGREARHPITGITLIAGFASTVGWPLSTLLEAELGWRGACAVWAGLHLVLGLPLNATLPRAASALPAPGGGRGAAAEASPAAAATDEPPPAGTALLLGFAFAAILFVSTAMAAHLPRLLEAAGSTPAAAVALAALLGPAQVAGRLLEFGLLRHLHPLLSARLAALMHPVGAAGLALAGGAWAAPFAVLHGLGNGVLTIARGTLPLALFGPGGYGLRQGMLLAPARIAQAFAPWLFGVAIDRWGAGALWCSAALGAAVAVAMFVLRAGRGADASA